MRSFAALSLFIAVAGFSAAQTIDPNSVSLGTRTQWCVMQKSACPQLCLQEAGNSASTSANDCDPKTLVYHCVCAASGISPNLTEYSETMPYFECTESNNQCVKNCGNSNTCADACRANHPCGAKDPTRVNTSTISTMASTASRTAVSTDASGSAVYTGFGAAATTTGSSSSSGGSSGSSSKSAGQVAISLGQSYGVAVVIAGLLGGMALVL